jgi:ribosomal protein S18 acetylase RimI-like enzyme
MNSATRIVALTNGPQVIASLSELLVETVAHGGSVSFMHPLAREVAQNFWRDSLTRADSGGRVVLGALQGDEVIGTVTLDLATPPNQPHRAEIAKLMTRVSHRRRGVARRLMLEAERMATERNRTLLVLDTAAEEGAAGFYEGLGYQRVGIIPSYALKPHGGLTGTIICYKVIGSAAPRRGLSSGRSPEPR